MVSQLLRQAGLFVGCLPVMTSLALAVACVVPDCGRGLPGPLVKRVRRMARRNDCKGTARLGGSSR